MGLRFLGNILLIYRSKISTIYKKNIQKRGGIHNGVKDFWRARCGELGRGGKAQALVSFKKYMPPLFRYFKVNIYPFPLPHFASLFFAYLWSFRWPNYIFTLPRYFSFRLPHLNIATVPPSNKLDKNSQRTWLIKHFSQWNGYSHFRFALDFSYTFGIHYTSNV